MWKKGSSSGCFRRLSKHSLGEGIREADNQKACAIAKGTEKGSIYACNKLLNTNCQEALSLWNQKGTQALVCVFSFPKLHISMWMEVYLFWMNKWTNNVYVHTHAHTHIHTRVSDGILMPSEKRACQAVPGNSHRHALRVGLLPSSLAHFPVQMVAKQSPERDT